MKLLISFFITILLLSACNTPSDTTNKPTHPLTLVSINGEGWSRSSSYLKCDSIQMVNKTEAFVWVNGTKMHIYADKLRVHTNRNN